MANTPEIRFKGFSEDWERQKLGDVYQKIRNAFVGTVTPYYVDEGHFYLESNNVKDGQINRNTEIFINDEFYERQKDNWLHTGDLVMVQSGHVGHMAVIPESLNNTAAHALIIIANPLERISPYFVNYQFQNQNTKDDIANITTGNTIKHILASEVKKIEIVKSSYEEQLKMGTYFQQIDSLIALHQYKCDEMSELKKYMLQKMFPKKGEQFPEIRFNRFTKHWEERKLGDIILDYTEKNPKDEDLPVLTSSRQGIQKQEDHFGSEQKHDTTDYNVIPRGYCTYRNRSDDKTFTFNVNDCVEKGIVSKFYPVFSIVNGNAKFITEYLNTNAEIKNKLAVLAVGTSQVVLSLKNLKNLSILVPAKEEQDKIGEAMIEIDNFITHHQRMHDNLKELKKYMLQNMFPKKG